MFNIINSVFGVCFVVRNKIDVPHFIEDKKSQRKSKRKSKTSISHKSTESSMGDVLLRYGPINDEAKEE